MRFPYLVVSFFTLFFTLQLFFGEAGVVAFVQEKYITNKVAKNVAMLRKIQKDLKEKENLSHRNRSYMRMNAHRVGLLSKDEYLITLDSPLFAESISYSPGVVLANKSVLYVSNAVLFFISIAIHFLAVAFYILKRNCTKSAHAISSVVEDTDSIKVSSSQPQSVIDNSEEYHTLAMNSECATIFSDTEIPRIATRYISLHGDKEDQMEKSLWQAST